MVGQLLLVQEVQKQFHKIKQNLALFVKRKYKVKNSEAIYENSLVKFKEKTFRFNALIKEAYLNRVSLSSSGFYLTPKMKSFIHHLKSKRFYLVKREKK